MTRDEEDALIRAAKAYDHDHRPRSRNWSQVPDHQVRRLLIGAGLIQPPPPPAEQAGRDVVTYPAAAPRARPPDPVSALADAATRLAGYALAFGRVNRSVCRYPDGTPESDSDHTVMLTWLAPALAAATAPQLDPLLVAAYAAVHDATEVFAGDTQTLRITAGEREAKAARERAAAGRWGSEFRDTLPWLPAIIGDYETQSEPEARFVRALDKICPKFLHVINGGRDLADYGMSSTELAETLRRQRTDIGSYAGEFDGMLALYDEMAARAIAVLAEAEAVQTA